MAFLTALMMPLLVKVAPATISTSALFAATMASGICSRALPAMLGVSLLETTVTPVMVSPSMVTSTVMGPMKPSAVPVRAPPEEPALSRAFLTALMMPLLVKVAPATISTSALLAATMAAGICSRALPAMLGVSLLETTVTPVMVSPSMVTSTVMGPMKPSAVPVSGPEAAALSSTNWLAALTALTTAEEVMVAPVMESMLLFTARSPWLFSMSMRKSQSPLASWPRP